MLQLNNASFHYKTDSPWIFQNFNLTIADTGILGLLGHNGAGKSTLMSILAGLYKLDDGQLIDTNSNQRLLPEQLIQNVSLVPQDFAFYQKLSVKQNLELFFKVADKKQVAVKVNDVVDMCQLDALLNKPVATLSGGQKRRLNLAIGLLKDAQLLLLDEPTVGIDPESKQQLLKTIRRIADGGKSIVFTSHILQEVEELVDDICILDQGILKLAPTKISELSSNQQAILQVPLSNKNTVEGLIASHQLTWVKPELCMVHQISYSDYVTLLQKIEQLGISLNAFSYGGNALEHLYFSLTQESV